jgi:hypothetical protein
MNWQIALVAALALTVAPMATAATLTVDEANVVVPPGGSYAIPFTYSEACTAAASPSLTDILTGTGSVDASITATGGNLTYATTTATLDYTSCLAAPPVDPVTTGTLLVSADQWAQGMTPITVTLSDGTATANTEAKVNYTNIYTVSTDATFPLETVDGMAKFNLTMTVTANAPSMIMFFKQTASCGSVTGLPEFLNINDGDYISGKPTLLVQEISYTNTCSDNEMDSFVFDTVAHNVAYSTDLFETHQVNWTFENNGGNAAGETSEETPGVGLVVIMAALGAIVIARRK